jgi:phage-related protein
MKTLLWVGKSKENLREFPDAAQDEAGSKLRRIQYGQTPEGIKPLAQLGKGIVGVQEIRIDCDKETYRVVYVARLVKGVYVLHAFHKKSKTGIGIPSLEKNLIIENYKAACEYDAS